MVLGFNHNIRYRGELFHVQTEDSGIANPHIITLLYRGGTILASSKTSYADIIKVEQLEAVVESIMKEQHKDMMRRLKNGEFDARIFPDGAPAPATEEQGAAVAEQSPAVQTAAASPAPQAAPAPPSMASPPQQPPPAPPAPTVPPASSAHRSLDEVILDYLITGEDK
ncbi:hypothetical protein KP001_15075 [Geomonas subterranea]|uniref:Uncharacterized protein n=1 Tax=Geomonas subterranea TaxID=2847989 RepID=A0ABX8LJK8_9BACT|nr:hypothetical protein [Geomonas subterranea]QXE89745.1 hypothetical protein KP001_15075 [Geomonas subterranea]QXM08139.1 hypothetical protein KP002_14205 [Geomonas subterranea]